MIWPYELRLYIQEILGPKGIGRVFKFRSVTESLTDSAGG